MQPMRSAVVLAACLTLAACHHATIRTGAVPGDIEVNDKWASSWVYGLVPPSDVETAEDCSNGVAVVETKRSFLNGLVGLLTFGIYTPMEIKVRCAATSGEDQENAIEFQVPEDGTLEEIRVTLERAADLSFQEERPVHVQF